ncbi:MAG: GNAT family N-acetyltransferase [Pseudomonadales bacterium]
MTDGKVVNMKVDVRSAKQHEAPIVDNLLQLYLYDFSRFEDIKQGEDGRYRYPYLAHYWEDPARYPFLFRVDGKLAGFALLRLDADPVTGQQSMDVTEFFVSGPYRRRGIGAQAAQRLWDLFPGQWHVRVLKWNDAAYHFWKQVIGEYTHSRFNERVDDGITRTTVFVFHSGADSGNLVTSHSRG